MNRGVGAEPGGFPGERRRWILRWITDCSAAYPTTVPVLALSMLFAGSQLIPRDSCSLCESGCRPGPDPTWGKAPEPPVHPQMLKGYFPKDPTLVPAQASLWVSPEWDPEWVRASIEHLGWDSGKWEIWSQRQNG